MQKVYYRDWNASRRVPVAFAFSRLAAPLSRLLAAAGVRPNHVTALVAVTGSCAVLLALGGAWMPAAAALLWFLVLDHADGQVARLTDQRTRLGGYLDTLVDYTIDVAFLAAIAAWGVLHDDRVALLGLMALAAYALRELIVHHNGRTMVLAALRAGDFRARGDEPTIRGPTPVVPHRDLNIIVLAAGLLSGLLAWSLAALAAWWAMWAAYAAARGTSPPNTHGVLITLMHGDNH